jgi:hypothetical protein
MSRALKTHRFCKEKRKSMTKETYMKMEVGRRTFLKGVGMLAASSVATGNAVLAANTLDGKPGQGESQFAEKPKPIISGPSQAEGIAKFATRTNYEDFTPERRERLKVVALRTRTMFFRVKRAGSYQYLQIVHSVRQGEKVRQQVFGTLGRLDELKASGRLEALIRSGLRHCEKLPLSMRLPPERLKLLSNCT